MRKLFENYNVIKGPKPIGPYSSATVYKGIMYVSGQIGIDPKTLELVSEDVEEQTRRALDNFGILLTQTNCEYSFVLKTTLYLKNMQDFSKVNQVYSQYFRHSFPARTCIAVSQLPKNAKFEMDAMVAYPYDSAQLDNDMDFI